MQDLADKIKKLRKSLGLNQDQLAARIGLDVQSTVSKWERGKQRPNAEYTAKLAELAGETMGQFIGAEPLKKNDAAVRNYRVVGELQAGAWKESLEWDFEDQYEIPCYVGPNMPNYPLKGFVVRGPSMNKLYPEGAIVFAAATISNGLTPKSGNKVIVSRRDQNGLYESTIKEFVVEPDGSKWLWPRSYDPEHQAPVEYNNGRAEEVTITGIIMASFIVEAMRG